MSLANRARSIFYSPGTVLFLLAGTFDQLHIDFRRLVDRFAVDGSLHQFKRFFRLGIFILLHGPDAVWQEPQHGVLIEGADIDVLGHGAGTRPQGFDCPFQNG